MLARDVIAQQPVRAGNRSESEALGPPGASEAGPPVRPDVHTRAAEEKLRMALGTRVRILRKGKGGRIEIDFTSEDELQRLYEALVH